MPITNQTINLNQVLQGSATINANAEMAPMGATNQTQGVVNFRGKLGSRMRSIRMPAETITKASSVPMEQRLPASRTVNTAEKHATPMPVIIEVIQGVRKRVRKAHQIRLLLLGLTSSQWIRLRVILVSALHRLLD